MPTHSAFYWAVYLIWTLGFAVTSAGISIALREALADRRRAKERGLNGLIQIEARRAVRLEIVRLAQSVIFALLGLWAIFSPDPQQVSLRGAITLGAFLLMGALICSQTWFDRIDLRAEMQR